MEPARPVWRTTICGSAARPVWMGSVRAMFERRAKGGRVSGPNAMNGKRRLHLSRNFILNISRMFDQRRNRRFVRLFPPSAGGMASHRVLRAEISRGPVFCLLRTIPAECGQKACMACLSLIDAAAFRPGPDAPAPRILRSTRGAFRFVPRRQQEDVRLCQH